ncbi:MAG: hypothetical protein ACYCPQ_02835 [Elusimicrobiota bacterium]
MIFFIFAYLFSCLGASVRAQAPAVSISTDARMPTYLSAIANINDYYLFADGGPDSNWYIGFNNAWIVKLPPAPAGRFSRAFIGAKIGRAKTAPDPNAPWRRDVIAGKIYMAVSQTPGFSPDSAYFLADTKDCPREADPQSQVAQIGASRWFWAQVPLSRISFVSPNYLVIWSPSPALNSSQNSPILAADNEPGASCDGCAWNNSSITGAPPRDQSQSLQTPLDNLFPALAIKLVPQSSGRPPVVSGLSVFPAGKNMIVRFLASGQDVSAAWIEISQDRLDWRRLGSIERHPPFIFTLKPDLSPRPGEYLRGAARDTFGNVGYGVFYENR